ncbi:hypothetical protein [Spirosoma sp. KNUC1025]|uniref:hypothetical protein n=1 Tax=Spirosoma sp. KNUC1025 TaxID=2894082 RepID=UPI0038648835|nr:hypothetical protein LN737_19025 [Spirosoma sp. KNUC1025]
MQTLINAFYLLPFFAAVITPLVLLENRTIRKYKAELEDQYRLAVKTGNQEQVYEAGVRYFEFVHSNLQITEYLAIMNADLRQKRT